MYNIIMKIPSFRYVGGKARLRNWLLTYFPQSGSKYLELFVGLGNVYFLAKTKLNFEYFIINDIDTYFFESIIHANLDLLPEKISKNEFKIWKNNPSYISKIIEPRITFGGKGYSFGYSGSSGTHVGYNRSLYYLTCKKARELLLGTQIFNLNWENFDLSSYKENDFIYCDPPYLGKKSPYPNINHEKLVTTLNSLKCKWAISGYDNNLYNDKLLYINKYTKERNSELKSSNSGKKESVTEVLWTNY